MTIPDIFFEHPFPLNIPSEDIVDYYCQAGDAFNFEEFNEVFHGDDDSDEANAIAYFKFLEMMHCYMRDNIRSPGIYFVLVDAYEIVQGIENDGSLKKFFDDHGVDLTHLIGKTESDLVTVILPVSILKKPDKFLEKMRKIRDVEIWENDKE